MKNFILKKRYYITATLFMSLVVGILSMYIILKNAYDSYWLVIYRVQTADFNIISSAATGTVSSVIEKNDIEKAIEIVESNYCLFRVSISRCIDDNCNQKEVIADNANSSATRCRSLDTSSLPEIEVPIFKKINSLSTISYAHTYSKKHEVSEFLSKPIGFLNLYRGNPIPFKKDIYNFFESWFFGEANASRHSIYKNGTFLSLFISISVFLILFSLRLIYISEIKRNLLSRKFVDFIERTSA